MNLLVIIINNEDDMDKIMHIFLEVGIRGATIIDSTGMGRIVSHEIPIFAGLRELTQGSHPKNKTIMTVVQDEDILEETKKLLNKTIDFNKPGVGIFFTIPIEDVHGLAKSDLAF